MSQAVPRLRALHIASGDLWAGAEVQLFTLLTHFCDGSEVAPHAALLNEGDLARRLRERNIPVTIFDERRMNGVQIACGLRRLMAGLRPDIVHTHRQKENVLGSIANLLTTRAKSVRTCHGAPEHKPAGIAALHKQLFYALDLMCGRLLQQGIIAVSAPLAQDLAAHFAPASITVIGNGIDVDAVRAAVSPVDFRNSAPDAIHVGIVGRLEAVKRVDLFLETCVRLVRAAPDKTWRFHVIGDGSLRAQLQRHAATLGIQAAVTFHGHRFDSAACLAALDVLVMCSDHEGMPMTPLEAIAVGTPVVAHAVGGLRELLSGAAGGILVDDHAPAGYASAVLALLQSDQNALLEQGIARVRSEYSAAVNATKVADLYRNLVHLRGGG